MYSDVRQRSPLSFTHSYYSVTSEALFGRLHSLILGHSCIIQADRMRLVVKNKEEGTELFKGGNFRPAAARYHKALTHSG